MKKISRFKWTIDEVQRLLKAGTIQGYIDSKPAAEKKKRRPKFNNEKVEFEGQIFDSRKEYKRYRELLLLIKTGIIGQLRRQVKYLLIEATDTTRKTEYWADFVYIIVETGETIVEDVKSEATRKLSTYVIKKKLMKTVHQIDIKEI